MRSAAASSALASSPSLALGVAGCGSSDDDGGDLLVSAATSLKTAFTSYGEQFDDAKAQFSFAGSDELAAQIRSGAKPDVFASANTKLPDELFAEGLVEKPAGLRHQPARARGARPRTRRWPASRTSSKQGVTIAIGAAGVPIGAYTRKVLDRLDAAQRKAILANVRSEEPDVGGIAAKLGQGAVDAGFLYITDVIGDERPPEGDRAARRAAARGRLRRRDRQGRAASRGSAGGSSRGCWSGAGARARCRATARASRRRPRGYRDP